MDALWKPPKPPPKSPSVSPVSPYARNILPALSAAQEREEEERANKFESLRKVLGSMPLTVLEDLVTAVTLKPSKFNNHLATSKIEIL